MAFLCRRDSRLPCRRSLRMPRPHRSAPVLTCATPPSPCSSRHLHRQVAQISVRPVLPRAQSELLSPARRLFLDAQFAAALLLDAAKPAHLCRVPSSLHRCCLLASSRRQRHCHPHVAKSPCRHLSSCRPRLYGLQSN
ncbi:hypothetical protein M0R45_016199 [Rubus argutus]|uniref:Uncharacterized protein n=1 Tax=Rubus argutus TaxID=59490 RepID=A0AAW1XSE4_RUBAR